MLNNLLLTKYERYTEFIVVGTKRSKVHLNKQPKTNILQYGLSKLS